MCLYNNVNEVKRILKDKKGQEFIYAWKLVVLQTTKTNADGSTEERLTGPYRKTFKYKPGWNKSNSKRQLSFKYEEINRGIHVYRNHVYVNYVPDNGIFIKVRCYLKDLIGVNWNEMVFRKIYIPTTTFMNAFSNRLTKDVYNRKLTLKLGD